MTVSTLITTHTHTQRQGEATYASKPRWKYCVSMKRSCSAIARSRSSVLYRSTTRAGVHSNVPCARPIEISYLNLVEYCVAADADTARCLAAGVGLGGANTEMSTRRHGTCSAAGRHGSIG
jgi:hypothetical protein